MKGVQLINPDWDPDKEGARLAMHFADLKKHGRRTTPPKAGKAKASKAIHPFSEARPRADFALKRIVAILTAAKENLPPGQWGAWLKKHGIGRRRANLVLSEAKDPEAKERRRARNRAYEVAKRCGRRPARLPLEEYIAKEKAERLAREERRRRQYDAEARAHQEYLRQAEAYRAERGLPPITEEWVAAERARVEAAKQERARAEYERMMARPDFFPPPTPEEEAKRRAEAEEKKARERAEQRRRARERRADARRKEAGLDRDEADRFPGTE